MKIKIICLFLLLIFSTAESWAQLRVGPLAGLHLAKLRVANYGDEFGPDYKTAPIAGIHLGGIAEYRFKRNFGGELGMILFVKKGVVEKQPYLDGEIKGKSSITYLQVPLHFTYHLEVNDLQFIFKTGPYLALALDAKTKRSGDNISSSTDDIGIGNGPHDGIKRFDQGWDFAVGFDITDMGLPVQATLCYSLGITNISVNTDPITARNRALTLSVSYFLFEFEQP